MDLAARRPSGVLNPLRRSSGYKAFSMVNGVKQGMMADIVIRGVAVADERLARLVSPDGIRQGWPWCSVFRVQMADAQRVWSFLILPHDDKRGVASVLRLLAM